MSIGHNSTGTSAQLQAFVERIEKLEYDKSEIQGWVKEVYAEAKSTGFDVKILRKVVALRKRDREEVFEEEALIETYLAALGMLADTPLGQAAMKRDGVAG
jgi:uncharacterized protein (UPF0335 family)